MHFMMLSKYKRTTSTVTEKGYFYMIVRNWRSAGRAKNRTDLTLWKAGLSQSYSAYSTKIFQDTHALEYVDMPCHLQSDYEKLQKDK